MAPRPSSAAECGAPRKRRLDDEELKSWAAVDAPAIEDAEARARYARLVNAIELYAHGGSIVVALQKAQVGKRQFFRLIASCRRLAWDGRSRGYRALVERSCIDKPSRRADRVAVPSLKPTAGYGGLFDKLLRDHPAIEDKLVAALRRKGINRLAPNTMNFRWVHRQFLKICRDEKLSDNDYPLSTISQGRAPLRRWLKRDFMSRHAVAWLAAEVSPDAAQAAAYGQGNGQDTLQEPLWAAWQIDEQTVDALARYDLVNENGDVDSLDLERFMVIRVIEVRSSANLAWSMVIARQVAVHDLVAVLWDALNGQPPAAATVEGLRYQPGAGYPANVIERLRWALPRVVYLDNALAHLAEGLQRLLLDLWGGQVRVGRPGVPQERAEVESQIKLMASQLLHQLPATTGPSPRSAVRKRASRPVKDRLDVAELTHTIDTYLANKNLMPAAASRYAGPLDWISRQLETGRVQPASLPVAKRRAHLFYPATSGFVRADMNRGRRPFVNFMGARYSSDMLSSAFDIVGAKFSIRCDPRDLRTIWLYEVGSGHEWGALRALGRWGAFPHDMRLRKMFLLLKRDAEFSEGAADDPLERLYAHLRARATRSRQDATRFAYLMTYLEAWIEAPDSIAEACRLWRAARDAANDAATLALPSPASELLSEPATGPVTAAAPVNSPPGPTRVVTCLPMARRRVVG